MLGAWSKRTTSGLAIVAVATVSTGFAQDGGANDPSGLQLTLDLAQSLFVGDNLSNITAPTGTSSVLETDLTFGLKSETRVSSLALAIGGTFEVGYMADNGGNVSGFTDPTASLSYSRESKSAQFSLSGSYREREVGDTVITDEFTNEDLIVDNGDRVDTRLAFGLKTGVGGPWGADVSGSFAQTTYTGTTSTSLNDTETLSFSGRVWMKPNRATTISLTASQSESEKDDAANTVTERTRIGVSAELDVSAATQITASLFSSVLKTTSGIGVARASVVDDGLGFSFGVEHDLPNGGMTASYSRSVERGGERDTIRFSRSFDLPSGSFSFNIGGTKDSGQDFDPLYGFSLVQAMKSSRFTASLSQAASTDTDGDTSINSSLSVTYAHEITSLSSVEIFGRVSDSNVLTGPDPDQNRTSIGVAYNHALTKDWDLRTGYNYRKNTSGGATVLESNQLFATLSRSFNLRP